jgi:hypothetical protein
MNRSSPLIRLALAAAIPLAIGAGVAMAAPSASVEQSETVVDADYRPGMDGVDIAAVTGPVRSSNRAVPACADPARRGELRPCER